MHTCLNVDQNIIVIVSLVTLFTIVCYIWINSKFKNARLPPGPRGLPILGYLPFLSSDLHLQFTQMSKTYGPIYKLWLGRKLVVVINSPSLVKQVVRDHDVIFANRDPPMAALALTYGGKDITWSPLGGTAWLVSRKVFVREMMSNSSLDACYDLRKEEVLKTITHVGKKIETAIDFGDVMFKTELNVIISLLWGGSNSMNDDVKSEFRKVVTNIAALLGKPNLSDFFPVLAKFDLQGIEKEIKGHLHWVDVIFNDIIEKRTKDGLGSKGRRDILQCLLELNEQEDTVSTHITIEQIRLLLMNNILGGTETTTSIAEWTMAELLGNPDMMKKTQQEISEVVGANNIVEESHLPKLHYLEAVIKEAFRLHPVIPFLIPRCPSAPCMVGGYTVPKGTRVWINTYAIHRDPQIWENHDKFKPDRFLNDDKTNTISKWDYTGNNFEYLPFGSGRRVCPGLPLAERMLKFALASLLHSFDWRLPDGVEIDLSATCGITFKKRIPLFTIPSRRSNSL